MEAMSILAIVWGVLTAVLVVLLIYRSTLSMHEEDLLFLDGAEAHLESEQRDLTLKMNRIRPFVNVLGASSILLVLAMGSLWVYHAWTHF